jgi:hypothetical protein
MSNDNNDDKKLKNSSDNKDFLTEARLNPETRRERPKRVLVPSNVKISRTPQLATLVNDALSIIGAELSHYSKKTKKGLTLDLKESRAVTAYMDALIKMSKEARESQKPEHLEHLSDEQLLAIANQNALEAEEDTNSED